MSEPKLTDAEHHALNVARAEFYRVNPTFDKPQDITIPRAIYDTIFDAFGHFPLLIPVDPSAPFEGWDVGEWQIVEGNVRFISSDESREHLIFKGVKMFPAD